MSKRLLHLVDSDSEDGLGGGNTSHGARPTALSRNSKSTTDRSAMPPAKKAKTGRQGANKVTKPAPNNSTSKVNDVGDETTTNKRKRSGDKMSDAPQEAEAKGPGKGRGRKRAVAEVEEEEEEDSAPPTPPAVKQKAGRSRPRKVIIEESEPQPAGSRKGRKATKKPDPDEAMEDVSEIPETQQPNGQQVDTEDEEDDSEPSPQAEVGRSSAQIPSSPSKRLHTASSDGGDPALRRRLGEITQKYESLELKYRDLREIGVKEAERNFDKLKKQSEEKSKAADQLIATLKSELATQKEASKEIQRLKKQLETSESKADALQAKLTDLTTSLSDSKSEIKSLNLKLTAARNAEAAATAAAATSNRVVPGSAMKKGATASRLAAGAASEAVQQVTLAAQKKEDLYGDLTGLIVRSVKREDGEDKFDCLQTGRNGTLHFKLAIEVDAEGGEAHCHYTPQLDPNRDRALIAVLPGFLVDEISFPQTQAGKFYARVLKALSEPPEAA